MSKHFIFMLFLIFATSSTHAAFETPDANSNGWGGWSRGDAGTLYAEWDVFDALVDNTPDLGSANTTTNIVSEISNVAFVTGGGNIYSPSFTTMFDIDIAGNGPSGPAQVAVQLKTLGTGYGVFTLEGQNPDNIVELAREPFPGFGGDQVETLFIWNLAMEEDNYDFYLQAAGSSMSLDRLAIDIGPTPVPLPAGVYMLMGGLLGLVRWVKKSA